MLPVTRLSSTPPRCAEPLAGPGVELRGDLVVLGHVGQAVLGQGTADQPLVVVVPRSQEWWGWRGTASWSRPHLGVGVELDPLSAVDRGEPVLRGGRESSRERCSARHRGARARRHHEPVIGSTRSTTERRPIVPDHRVDLPVSRLSLLHLGRPLERWCSPASLRGSRSAVALAGALAGRRRCRHSDPSPAPCLRYVGSDRG